MFGYIIVNKPEMKIKDFEIYHAYYCGLCQSLKERYGMVGQTTLSYDMIFLHILLTALYEPEVKKEMVRCVAHPLAKHPARISEYTAYAADMNIILTYYKCKDDWNDDKNMRKLLYGKMLNQKGRKLRISYEEKLRKIESCLKEISAEEAKGTLEAEQMAGKFGEVMAEIFAYRKDEWEKSLRKIGFYLGKFIYLLDAYEDIEKDLENGSYNPFREEWKREDFREHTKMILTMMMAECSAEFERLPILEHLDILRNILYSGVWFRYEAVNKKRYQDKVEENV